jgi:hypothetical protein
MRIRFAERLMPDGARFTAFAQNDGGNQEDERMPSDWLW